VPSTTVTTRTLVGLGDDAPFERRLAEAIAWCAPRVRGADPAGSLRDPELRPRALGPDRASAVRTVVRGRASRSRTASADGVAELQGGRLLIYFPDADLSDGAAEAESGGFFDVYNTPPWDTWVALFRDEDADVSTAEYVVCWVPPALIEVAARGIEVNPERCIVWLEESQTNVARELRLRGMS
jgi:hypothetical protein